jgi:hypothetical protein
MFVDRDFWLRSHGWPSDDQGYVFLARAVDEVGKHLFGGTWSSDDPRAFPPKPADFSAMTDMHLKFSPYEWKAAAADVKKKFAAANRFDSVVHQIATWCRRGQLVVGLRPVAGGAISSQSSTFWQTERLEPRFHRCQMNPKDPYGIAIGGKNHQYIFVTRETLDRCLESLPKQADRNVEPLNEKSEVLKTNVRGRPRGTGFPYNEIIAREATRVWRSRPQLTKAEAIRESIENLRNLGTPIPNNGSYSDRHAVDRIRRMMPPVIRK